jgi:hypothetical protein
MLKAARQVASRLRARIERRREDRTAVLYSPDADDLDVHCHVAGAIDWLKQAQDAGADRGVSYGVRFGGEFQESYPETTGYIIPTFVGLWQRTGETDLLNRAIEMGVWESAIQLPDGAVMGGKLNSNPTPAVFNTGMVMLGWNALIRVRADERFTRSCNAAAEWLVRMQEPDGDWIRGNSKFALAGVYNVKAAWALCETGQLLGNGAFVQAAVRNAEFSLSKQEPNGWFRDCCSSDPQHPLLHTLAYAMQGLIGIGKLTGRQEFIDAARLTADAEMRIMREDGFLPGCQDSRFGAAAQWCCLTGSAQLSTVWSELYLLTGEKKYVDAVKRINRYLMARHDLRNADARLRGGLAGSWPTSGDYHRLTVVNWAAKFLADALILEQEIDARALAKSAS